MRNEYNNFIRDNRINDTLSLIYELSYSQKLKILKKLFMLYSVDNINIALNEYELNYIRLNRVDIKIIFNTLKGIIQRYEK